MAAPYGQGPPPQYGQGPPPPQYGQGPPPQGYYPPPQQQQQQQSTTVVVAGGQGGSTVVQVHKERCADKICLNICLTIFCPFWLFIWLCLASSPGINCIEVTYDASLFAFDTGCFVVTSQYVSRAYTVVEAYIGWNESRLMCQKNVTELAIIKFYQTDSKLKQIMKDYETPNEDVFKWLDDGVAENIPWATNEPNCETVRDRDCLRGEESCVAMNLTLPIKSSFLTLSCQQNCMGLCQKQDDLNSVTLTEPSITTPSTVVPVISKETITTTETPTTLFESSNTNLSYHLFLEKVSSNDAADLCNSFDMKIATIESELIYNLVKDYLHSVDMGRGCMWIGLYWELQTLRHVWDDGEPLTWAQWYNGAPSCTHPTYDTHCNGIERNCVSFTRHFNFRTKDCNGTCYMLCESNRSRIDITTNNINLTLSSATPTEITTSNINLSLSSATHTEITTSYINLTLSSATPTEITTSSNNLTLSSATPIEITTSYINLTLSSATPTEITTNSNNLTLSSATPTEITTSSNNLTLSSATHTEITTHSNNLTLSSATPSEITASNINLTLSSATPTEELSVTSEITNVITASPALNTLWKVGAWSFHYIHLDNEDVNLTHARQLCKEKNMDIVIIKDEGRLENIKDIIQYLQLNGINNTGYWIGMVWNESIQEHKWLDNYTRTWTKWADEEPKCTGGRIALWSAMGPSSCQGKIQNCVVSDGSFFKTSSCSSLHKVICQQYIPVIAASNDETRPKVLNCKCPMQKINQKWHFLDGTNISEAKVEKLVQKDFEDNVKEYISVNKSVLSSVIQKRNSIDDKRPESKAIGWSATLFVAVPVTFIIIVDVIDMMRYLRSP